MNVEKLGSITRKISWVCSLYNLLTSVLHIPDLHHAVQSHHHPALRKIVVSGGPCAGKTLATMHLVKRFSKGRTLVLRVPQAATFIGKSGGFVNMTNWTKQKIIEFQINLMMTQLNFENLLIRHANKQLSTGHYDRVLVICDRGLIDGKAYVPQSIWYQMLFILGLTEKEICEDRYDMAIIMQTAAIRHQSQQKSIRHESPEKASQQHLATQKVWSRHPTRKRIPNTSQSEKLVLLDKIIIEHCLADS